ncbi:hypothetical protein BU16DRAFT_576900 [Lophium mytilinum]|uniref:Uncharacterized protein n=1 Tax=Lophium mytilinum TaxID=390894 RepID=A0A6A6REB7_9PEZI|nr:hypothetical protein BU16DRAFT_576900 [Lophium mytilinum]
MRVDNHLPMRKAPGEDNVRFIESTFSIYDPPCDCLDCQEFWYTREEQSVDRQAYETRVAAEEVKKMISHYQTQIFEDRKYLQEVCASHGDTILSRWKKRSRDKREAWILKANPTLCEHKWFTFRYMANFPSWKEGRRERKTFLLPYLSVEGLKSDPALFLSLLHNRAHYHPQEWAPYDSRQFVVPWFQGFMYPEFSDLCVSVQGTHYGETANFDAAAAHRADIIGFPRGRLIMEAQGRLMKFLRNLVTEILDGVDLGKPGSSSKWIELTQGGFKQSGSLEVWSPFTHQPFSAPPVFNIDALLAIAQSRVEAMGDHLWLLQTDSKYLSRHLKIVRDCAVYKNPALRDPNVVGIGLAGEIFQDFHEYLWWQWVLVECRNVQEQYLRFRDSIHPGQRLPPRYEDALGALELVLVNLMHSRAKQITALVPQRPGFRHIWEPERGSSPGEFFFRRKQATPIEDDPPKEKARIDSLLYEKLSNFSANAYMLGMVRLHRPLYRARDIMKVTDDRKAFRYFRCRMASNRDLELSWAPNHAIGNLLEKFSELPQPGLTKNRNWLLAEEESRKMQNSIWRMILVSFYDTYGKAVPKDIDEDSQVLCAETTPQYKAAIEAERRNVLIEVQRKEEEDSKAPQSFWGKADTEKESRSAESKAKVKTRPNETAEPIKIIREAEDVPRQSQQPKITVRQRTLDIISMMYPSITEESSKSVEWNDFVNAMAELHFSASHGGGSAVVFEPIKGNPRGWEGRIVFHKPHPVTKIDSVMIRSMGKRMNKWFGWEHAMFA